MPIFRKPKATIHAKGGPRPRLTPAAAQVAAARIAHFGQMAGAQGAASAAIANVLASAGIDIVQNGKGFVDTQGGLGGQMSGSNGATVDGNGVAGPSGYYGGAWTGLGLHAGGSHPTAGLWDLLTGKGTGGGGDLGVNLIDLLAYNQNTRGNPNEHTGANNMGPPPPADPHAEPYHEPVERPDPEGAPQQPERNPPEKPDKPSKQAYDPDSAGGSGYNPFYYPAYTPPKTRGSSTGDSEFGGTAAATPTGGRAGPRLGVSLNDAPLRGTASRSSLALGHGPLVIGPGGMPIRRVGT